MLDLLLYGLFAVLLALVLFVLAVRFLPAGEQIAPPIRDEPLWQLPAERRMQPADIDALRLPVALRGYRFAETDALLDRLAAELRDRDQEIARLRGHTVTPYGDVLPAPEPPAGSGNVPAAEPVEQVEQPMQPVQPVQPE